MLADRIELLLPANRRAWDWRDNDKADDIRGESKASLDVIRVNMYIPAFCVRNQLLRS